MSKDAGYLLPSEPSTDEFVCVKVFVPNRNEYIYALLGSIEYLSTWVAWERNAEKTAVLAATAWKAAFELTMENLKDRCLSAMEIQEIIELCCEKMSGRLIGIENAIKGVGVNSGGCGCLSPGDGDGASGDDATYDIDAGEYPPAFEDDPDPALSFAESRCVNAQGIIDDMISQVRGLEQTVIVKSSRLIVLILNLWDTIMSVTWIMNPFEKAVMSAQIMNLWDVPGIIDGVWGDFADSLENHKSDMINALFCADSLSAAKNDVLDIVEVAAAEAGSGWTGFDVVYTRELMYQIVWDMMTYGTFEKLHQKTDGDYASRGYLASACTCNPVLQGDSVLIDWDTFAPTPTGICLDDTASVVDDGGNLVLHLVAHASGNHGCAWYSQQAVCGMTPFDSIVVTGMEWDMKRATATNDDTIRLTVGLGAGQYLESWNGGILSENFSHFSRIMAIPMESTELGLGIEVRAIPFEQREAFRIDNIRIYYEEM